MSQRFYHLPIVSRATHGISGTMKIQTIAYSFNSFLSRTKQRSTRNESIPSEGNTFNDQSLPTRPHL
jgi:hypothetical protein